MRLAWLLVLALACLPACAHVRVVHEGETPRLDADEGLLLLAVDSSMPLATAVLEDEAGDACVLPALPAGRSHLLLVATQGRYRWQRADSATTQLRLADDPELTFHVEAERLHYVGDLVLRPVREERGVTVEASATLANHGLAAIDWLQLHHPRLEARYGLAFAGRYADPFFDFYAREHRGSPAAADGQALAPPPAPVAPVPFAMSRLARAPRFDLASLNPAGNLLALQVRDGDAAWRVEVIDLVRGGTTAVATSPVALGQLVWAGNRHLVLAAGAQPYRRALSVVEIRQRGRRLQATMTPIDGAGEVIHAGGNRLVMGRVVDGAVQLRRLDLSRRATTHSIDPDRSQRLAPEIAHALHWEVDGEGMPRLARVLAAGGESWVMGREGRFDAALKLDRTPDFEPVALARDGRWLYALTERDRAQRDAVAIDPATGAIARTLFSRPGVDVESLVLDERRAPVGVTYLLHGRRVSEFFGAEGAHAGAELSRLFPGETVTFASRSADDRRWAVWVQTDDRPARLRVVDLRTRDVVAIDGATPWLDTLPLARTQLLRVPTPDGWTLDAFLTLPANVARAPLVVVPHGGPIDIADTRQYDARVQFLAALGYAVLRVNFRGSAGHGRAFREAGYGAHGGAIEDDILTAIDFVTRQDDTARHVDADRMCLVGSSYGGYSGLMAAVRWPDRFRCVVSIGGVSDRLLAFTTSDSAGSPQGRAQMEQVIGDPRTQDERLRATSPLYRYRELRTPVMLAHGLEDRRVDAEQSLRLARMLALAGHKPVGLSFAGEGHGLAQPDNIDRLWNGVAGFLESTLGTPANPARVAFSASAP